MGKTILSKDLPNHFFVKSLFYILAIILGLAQTWKYRNILWTDAVSYLDIAEAYLNGDWTSAINACWSPAYSWILAAYLFLFKPSTYWELFLVKGVDFSIYIFTLFSFDFFLNEVIHYSNSINQAKSTGRKIFQKPVWTYLSLGYTIFIWSSIEWLIVPRSSPDMLVASLVYLVTAVLLKIIDKPLVWLNYILLGVLLGLGYLAKSFMLPLGLVFLISSIQVNSKISLKKSLSRVFISFLLMLLIALPFVTAISLQKGRLTFGDAGKINYAWYVSPTAPDQFWQGLPLGSGIPVHPTRKVHENPEVQEFASPVSGTYPPWYDPSYWNEGLKPSFNLAKQILVMLENLVFCWQLFLGCLILLVVGLANLSKDGLRGLSKQLVANWRYLLPSLCGLLSFILFTNIAGLEQPWNMIQTRYIAPFVVILLVGVFSCANLLEMKIVKNIVVSLTIATLIVTNFNLIFNHFKVYTFQADLQHTQWHIANDLTNLGIVQGDKVALVGQENYYWARLAKLKIIASLSLDFWSSDHLRQLSALTTLRNIGVKAVIQPPSPEWLDYPTPSQDWQKLPNSDAYIYFLK